VVSWGLVAGALAGVVELFLAWPRLGAFLSGGGAGRLSFLAFLCALYAAAGGLGALVLALVIRALDDATDLGPLVRGAFLLGGPGNPDARGSRVVAYGVGIALGLGLVGWGTRLVALNALTQFHHHALIAALTGAAAAGLALAAMVLAFVVAAALTPLLPFGPRLRIAPSTPPALTASLMAIGLGLGGAGVAALLLLFQGRPRMLLAQRALNTSLWAPTLVGAGIMLGLVAARVLGRRWKAQWLRRPAGVVTALGIALGLPSALGFAFEWSTVRQLDRRPFLVGLAMLTFAVAAGLTGVASGMRNRSRLTRFGVALILPLLLLGVALGVGRSDRVRKAALLLTGLGPPLMRGVQLAADLDRDGYSSVLGGGDCNDLDPDVHPGAFDWPDDGIDQNCNGHDATLGGAESRVWATVPPSVPTQPNVLLLTIDALRADHVGSYGYQRPTTPNLDAFAKDAVRFAHFFSHAPSTRYSVPAILTGRYPSAIPVGNANWPPDVLPENHLLAEMLKELGYSTAAIHSYHYFSRGWGLAQGFDEYDLHLESLHSMGGDPSKTNGTSARQLADADIAWLQKHDPQKPFFLWSHYYDTHFGFERHPDLPESNFGSDELALYDGEIRFTDYHLGRVFDEVKRQGLWDKTIIIITSDHGDGFGEHGLPISQRHGYHLYTNETSIPFLIRVPGVAPRVVDVPAGHVDIIPTLLNALGRPVEAEPQLLGQSLLPLMLGGTTAPPLVDKELGRLVYQEVWYEGPTSRKAVVSANWHYLANLVPDDTRELYDLATDFVEDHDLGGKSLPAEDRLRNALGAWTDQIALPPDFAARTKGNISTTPLSSPTALSDSIGGWFTLDGVDVATPKVQAGQQIDLSVVLRGNVRVPAGWRLFTHVIAANGRRLNADHDPVSNLYPLARLKKGTWLRDRIQVTLPLGWPRGQTTVEYGAFQGAARAPTHGAHAMPGDSVRIATIVVE